MKINYPIKYAAMPIIEQVGWSHGLHDLERDYDIVCYIVSKCYLISDLTKYTEDGHSIKEYEVVFPYQLGEFSKWYKVIPSYNLIHGYCINGNKVDLVFDSYEEALNYVSRKNDILCENTWKYLLSTEKILTKKEEFKAKLLEYKILEQQILSNTIDIEIGINKKLNSVIKVNDDKVKVLKSNIYEIIKLFDKDKFVVYSISQKQYDNIIKLNEIERLEFINDLKTKKEGLLLHKKENDFIKLGIEEKQGAYYIHNNNIIYDSEIDRVTKEMFSNIEEDTFVFYTTETMADLWKSYKNYPEIDMNEINGPVLKKVKK